ncbi:zinc finger BED domain-containing protein RICESLEEPER 3-like [Helianthus annuus]|uniref:zinc finger BED domain-containing protein RICESLEEPER 3-like n=1 Tax=Helianthus annuus TaxID=4232 RepID=UPI000B8F3218|nr:zinc finger BED domain-containing protein RICESLEEPER 3-like [Helianthus annuus]
MDMEGEGIIGCDGSNTQTHADSNQPMQEDQQTNTNQSQEQDQHTHEGAKETVDRKRKLTSPAWEHFKKIKVNGEEKAECNYCNTKLGAKSKNGTKHLLFHMEKCPKRKNKDIRQQVLSMNHVKLSGHSDVSCYNFDADQSRTDLAEMVIIHEILEKNASRIAITTDMWTSSNQKKGFMAITSLFIDDNWEMQSRIIRFIYVPCPHTGEVLANVLYESLCDWNIDRKMRCCAHILNLIVQDGLSIIADGIERIRDSVSYWTTTPKRYEKFEAAAHHLDVFKRLKQRDSQYNSLPSEKDWELASNICQKLKWSQDNEKVIQDMAKKMITEYDKYWSIIHGFMGVAAILDPRYKLSIMKHSFPKLYGSEKVASAEIEKHRTFIYELFEDYKRKGYENARNHGYDGSTSNKDKSESGLFDDYSLFVAEENTSGGIILELDHYLQEKVCPPDIELDILAWWKTNGLKYPILQKIARDVLAIAITTVASESSFSTSGRLVSPHRSRLHPSTLEALMCAQSWLLNEIRATCLKESGASCQTIGYDYDDGDETRKNGKCLKKGDAAGGQDFWLDVLFFGENKLLKLKWRIKMDIFYLNIY